MNLKFILQKQQKNDYSISQDRIDCWSSVLFLRLLCQIDILLGNFLALNEYMWSLHIGAIYGVSLLLTIIDASADIISRYN